MTVLASALYEDEPAANRWVYGPHAAPLEHMRLHIGASSAEIASSRVAMKYSCTSPFDECRTKITTLAGACTRAAVRGHSSLRDMHLGREADRVIGSMTDNRGV